MRHVPTLTLAIALGLVACSNDSSTGSPDAATTGTDGSPADAATSQFESFRITSGGGLCPADADCSGYTELQADGTLLFDRLGETPAVVHQAQVTPAERDDAIAVLTDPALIALLDLGAPPCTPPADVFESMTLMVDGQQHQNDTTFCDDAPLAAARTALSDLTQTYFP